MRLWASLGDVETFPITSEQGTMDDLTIQTAQRLHGAQTTASAPSPEESQRAGKLRDAARQFEAIFVKQMLKQGQQTTKVAGANPDEGLGGEFYQSMFHGEVARVATDGDGAGFGIAKMLMQEWGVAPDETAQAEHDLFLERVAPAEEGNATEPLPPEGSLP